MRLPVLQTCRLKPAVAGFALLLVASALLVAGVLLAAYLHWYQIQLEKERLDTTRARLAAIHEAITRYSLQHRKFPCPENPVPNPNAENRFDDTGNKDEDCAPDDTGLKDTNIEQSPVWRGVVPLKALHLDAQAGLDGWGNKITYVVTHYLTMDQALFPGKPHAGILRVYDQNMQNLLPVQDTGSYLLISHGPTGGGAWTPQGMRRPCPTGTMDAHNCDGGEIFIKAPFTTTPGANFYDDIVLTDAVRDRNLVEKIAICNSRHAFFSPEERSADPDGCIPRNHIWKGGCLSTTVATGSPVQTVAMAKAMAPPSIATPAPDAGALVASGKIPPNIQAGSCACGEGMVNFSGGQWDDRRTLPPYAPTGFLNQSNACMVPVAGKPVIGRPLTATARPASWCLVSTTKRTELNACTMQ